LLDDTSSTTDDHANVFIGALKRFACGISSYDKSTTLNTWKEKRDNA
jgi:hypothetical protein